jgi:polyhydroxyalkanoate synthesis regulator protein
MAVADTPTEPTKRWPAAAETGYAASGEQADASDMAAINAAVQIKRYGNRRLYNAAAGTYVTIDDLAAMVENTTDFDVFDAATGDDLTRSVLKEIIILARGRHGQG